MKKKIAVIGVVCASLVAGIAIWYFLPDPAADQSSHNQPSKTLGENLDPLGLGEDLTSFIRVEDGTVDDTTIEGLVAYSKLQTIDISGCGSVSDRGAVGLGKLSKLETLVAKKTGVGDLTAQELANLSKLEVVDLSLCDNLSDNGIEALVRATSIKSLKLSGCTGLTDKALLAIAKLPKLEVLDLSWNPNFSKDGLAAISRVQTLRELSLHHTPYTDNDVQDLQFGDKFLLLDVRECPRMSLTAIRALKQANPRAEIVR